MIKHSGPEIYYSKTLKATSRVHLCPADEDPDEGPVYTIKE